MALRDYSAVVTSWLLGVAIPTLVVDSSHGSMFFAIIIAKRLYGGLGQNPFNPAMVAYVVLLISFPVRMTSWNAPTSLTAEASFVDSFLMIFTGFNNETPQQQSASWY